MERAAANAASLPNKKKEYMIQNKITVEIWSDITCVHCFLAKRHFETALAEFKHRDHVDIIWRSFELAPNLVVDHGKSMYQFLADYNGATVEQVKEVCGQIASAGTEAGLTYNFEKAIPANSFLAHQFSHLAMDHHLQNEAKEALFKAHFTDGIDINNIDALKQIATSIGMDSDALSGLVTSNKYAEAVKRDEETAQKKGIKAVPHYLINSTHSITGAKESSVFLDALEKGYADLKLHHDKKSISKNDGPACEIGKVC
jgi:predicted DsbA family dithiol-disulfide isomerase